MSSLAWPMLTPPRPLQVWRSWSWELCRPADLTRYRRLLRAEALPPDRVDGDADPDGSAVERLLLAFEELTSNGVRHGRPPVWTTVTAASTGWLIDVTDATRGTRPSPPWTGTPP
ncbi:hypothetical protein A7K94_0219015, partial [Modestobacter sp. VKM Ac-2676]